jgi:hypothetical protein
MTKLMTRIRWSPDALGVVVVEVADVAGAGSVEFVEFVELASRGGGIEIKFQFS